MILQVSTIKTKALLLICKELMQMYQDNETQNKLEEKSEGIKEESFKSLDTSLEKLSEDLLKELKRITKFYYNLDPISQDETPEISSKKAIKKSYDFLNFELNIHLAKNEPYCPLMLCISFLSFWFKELEKENSNKEFIYFLIFPYEQSYDEILFNKENKKYKLLNLKMLELGEEIISKYDELDLK